MPIKILCSTAFHAAMPTILEAFSKISDETCDIKFGTTVALVEECKANANADVVILTESGIQELLKHQKIQTSTITPFAKTGVGIGIAKGAPRLDISSKEACIKTLLHCQSIAFTQFGASGMYFAKLIKTLGIEDLILAKAIRPEGGLVAELVAQGKSQLAVQLVSEIKAVPAVDLLGFLPEELQEWSIFSIAQTIHSNHAKVSQLVHLLQDPSIHHKLEPFGFVH
jgi:molybdate transport system substrate-binding protein